MSLTAAFTILLGKWKNSNITKRISLLSIIIVSIQAIYIVAINTINFNLLNVFIFYSTLGLLIATPILLLRYENKLNKSFKFIII